MESASPLSKKFKLNDKHADVAKPLRDSPGIAGDAAVNISSAKRGILVSSSPTLAPPGELSTSEQAPQWFIKFFSDFEGRQDARIESILDRKLGDLTSKVTEHEEKIKGLGFEVENLKASLNSLKEDNVFLQVFASNLATLNSPMSALIIPYF